MQKTVLKRVLSLVLCAVMLFGTVPMETHAEDMQESFVEGMEELNPFEPIGPEILEEPPVPALNTQAVLSRQMNGMYFPVAEEYYDDIVDFGGCRGSNTDVLYGVTFPQCIDADHAMAVNGNDGLDIQVPAGTEVYAPVSGTLYRSIYADAKLGIVAVIEQPAGNGYSYYFVLSNVNDSAPVAPGTPVNAGDLVAYAYGTLHFSAVMAPSGNGEKIALDAWWELDLIYNQGWLTEPYGTGLICVNPSFRTQSQYQSSLMSFLNGPITYSFVQAPAPVETTAPTELPTEPVYTEPPTEAPTQPAHTEHVYDAGVITLEPTHLSQGEITRVCTTCGASITEALPAVAEHTFDQRIAADAYLVSPASCVGGATYVYSCICGAAGTETFVEGGAADHIWDNGTVTKQASHTESGEIVFACTVCGVTYTEPIAPSAEHVYDQQNTDARFLKSNATCTSGAEYYMSCVCGAVGVETFVSGNPTGHSFSDSWTTNATHHWHAATCGHNEASGIGEHTWDGGKTTAQAGHVTDGQVTFTCTTCGFTRTEVVPGEPHVFDREVAEPQFLKTPATCTQGAVYFKSCACGQIGTETFISGDAKGHTYASTWSANEQQHWQAATCEHTGEKIRVADHIWDGGKVTVQPTSSSRGERTFTCVVCSATKKEALEPTTHEHTFANTWSGNDSYHWRAATCGHATEMTDFGTHVWNGGVITAQASHYAAGEVLYTCATCGLSKRETIPQQHVFDQRNTSSQYLKTPATCTSAPTYYFSCTCGAAGTDFFTYGYAQGHTVTNAWSSDGTYHWHVCTVCGSKSDISGHYYGVSNSCTTCGYAKQDSHVHTSHLTRVPAKNATCTQDGSQAYFVCECGKWFPDVSAVNEITDRNSLVIPATGHVDKNNDGKCDVCRERINASTVEYTMTEGTDAIWLNTSNQGLVFRASSDYSKFDHVEVDGSVISSMNYTISSGSTIVELSNSYLKRLTIGQHKITIAAKDGAATANFTIKQGTAAAPAEKSGGSIVWTLIAIIAILAMLGAAGVAGYILYRNHIPAKKKGGRFAK